MTMQEAAQTALDVQDACNLSGVLRTANEIVQDVIWPAAREAQGTKFVNRHPIVTLFLYKLLQLNGNDRTLDVEYANAAEAVMALAKED